MNMPAQLTTMSGTSPAASSAAKAASTSASDETSAVSAKPPSGTENAWRSMPATRAP